MMGCMKRTLAGFVAGAVTLAMPALAAAQDEPTMYDARLEGYATSVTIGSGSTALMWLLVLLLAGLCVGVMFKNPNRSHLD